MFESSVGKAAYCKCKVAELGRDIEGCVKLWKVVRNFAGGVVEMYEEQARKRKRVLEVGVQAPQKKKPKSELLLAYKTFQEVRLRGTPGSE
jgi:hypothetical protein